MIYLRNCLGEQEWGTGESELGEGEKNRRMCYCVSYHFKDWISVLLRDLLVCVSELATRGTKGRSTCPLASSPLAIGCLIGC